jgi:hypothetical protein
MVVKEFRRARTDMRFPWNPGIRTGKQEETHRNQNGEVVWFDAEHRTHILLIQCLCAWLNTLGSFSREHQSSSMIGRRSAGREAI